MIKESGTREDADSLIINGGKNLFQKPVKIIYN
jgi:hypothetical protein